MQKINTNRQYQKVLKNPFLIERRGKRKGPFLRDFVLLILIALLTRNFKILLKFINYQTKNLSKTKRQIQEIFRRNGQIRNYVLFTFCAGLALLLKKYFKKGCVIIDREYYGKEKVIKNIMLEILRGEKWIPQISFAEIGRKCLAHKHAYLTYSKELVPDCILKKEEILRVIKMTEVGKRLKDT